MSKFNIADKVRIAPKYKQKYNGITTIGTVLDIDRHFRSGRYKYLVKFEGKGFKSFYYSYELELVTTEKEQNMTEDYILDLRGIENIHDANALNERRKEFNQKVEAMRNKLQEQERLIQEERRERERREREEFKRKLAQELVNRDINMRVAMVVVERAWEDGHYAGYNNVRAVAQGLAEFAAEIARIQKETDAYEAK